MTELPGKGKFTEKLGQLHEYFMEGQLKNFMVAILALRMLPETLTRPKVLYVGSRAGEGSGRWLEVFALVALHLYPESIFVLMDPAEKNQEQIFMKEGRIVTYFRMGQRVTTDGSDYDMVIDDIYEPSKGTSRMKWKSKYWCVKVHEEGQYDNLINSCFHKTEGRAFSHPIKGSVVRFTSCECAPCQIVDSFAKTEEEFIYLRGQVHTIAKGKHCPDYPQYHDASLMANYRKKISIGQTVELESNAEVRVSKALSEIYPVQMVGEDLMKVNEDFSHGKAMLKVVMPYEKINPEVYLTKEIYPQFQGKKIRFFSVSPDRKSVV